MNLNITEIKVVISGSEQHSLMTAIQARLLYGDISNIKNTYTKSTPLKIKTSYTHVVIATYGEKPYSSFCN